MSVQDETEQGRAEKQTVRAQDDHQSELIHVVFRHGTTHGALKVAELRCALRASLGDPNLRPAPLPQR